MLRILYVAPTLSYTQNGIIKKQRDKIKLLEESGCYVKGLFFSRSLKQSYSEDNIVHTSIDYTKLKSKYAKFGIWRLLPYLMSRQANQTILNVLKEHIADFDIIYIRFPGSDINTLPVYKMLKKAGKKIVIELNGHYLNDERKNKKTEGSVFSYYKYFNEKFLQRKTMRYADLIVGVTHELTNYYHSLSPGSKKFTLSNGVDISRFPTRNPLPYDGTEVRFVFLSGSVNYWHGLDRFINGLKNYQGPTKIYLTVAGPVNEEYKAVQYKNKNIVVTYIDAIGGKQLDDLFNDHHIGIGSLGLHRMGLQEASVLKVREYIVRGLPFILGYNDTDLINSVSMKPFFIQFPGDESPVDIEQVLGFADRILRVDNYHIKMHEAGAPLVDYKPKIERLVREIENL